MIYFIRKYSEWFLIHAMVHPYKRPKELRKWRSKWKALGEEKTYK